MNQVGIDSTTHDTLESNDVLAFVSADLEKLGFMVEHSKKRKTKLMFLSYLDRITKSTNHFMQML